MKASELLAVSWPIWKKIYVMLIIDLSVPANRNEVAMEAISISDNVFLLLTAG